jgi:hypothetical protein
VTFPSGPGDRVHDYIDKHGKLLFQVCRRQTPDGKKVWARRPHPTKPGEFVNGLDGIDARPLYALPDVLDAISRGEQVHLVAGEKIADALHALGYVGTTNPFGESGALKPEQVEALRGARVVLWVDSDAPGRARGARAVEQLREVAAELRGPVDLDDSRDDGFDLADAIDIWHGLDVDAQQTIDKLVANADVIVDAPLEPALAIVVESLAESLENEPPEPDWIWRGFLAPTWITLLVGGPKAGKTTLLFALLDALAKGEPLFGLETRSTGALILTEQNPSVLKSTVDNFHFAFDRERVRVMYRRRQPAELDWHHLIDEAVTLCQRESIGLLVIDTFQRWAGMERDNDAPETLAAITALERAAESGLAVLVNHHHRKAGGTHGEEVSGPQALAAGVDVIMSLRRHPRAGENARKITADGRSMVTPPELTARLENGSYVLIEDDAAPSTTSVLDALREGPAGYDELQERTDLPRRTIERAIAALRESGDVTETRDEGNRKRFESRTQLRLAS